MAKPLDIQSIAFEIERIASRQVVPNMVLDVKRGGLDNLEGIVITMQRSLLVHRDTFPEKSPEVTYTDAIVTVGVDVPTSWWDHAKQDVRALAWLTRRGLLKPPTLDRVEESEEVQLVTTVKNYRQDVTILDDRTEIPPHLGRHVEIPYHSGRIDFNA